jgi:hypothetical protein
LFISFLFYPVFDSFIHYGDVLQVNVQGRQVYVDDFENDFLKTTQLFYKQESQQFLAHNTVPDYLRKVCPADLILIFDVDLKENSFPGARATRGRGKTRPRLFGH